MPPLVDTAQPASNRLSADAATGMAIIDFLQSGLIAFIRFTPWDVVRLETGKDDACCSRRATHRIWIAAACSKFRRNQLPTL